MLFYLFRPEEVRRLLEQLGYPYAEDTLRRTVECYLPRTSHGSTLSYVVHASVLDLIEDDAAWAMFTEALRGDVEDIQGGTTREGIHLGAIGGTVDIVFRHFIGLDATGDVIAFRPRLPETLRSMRAQVRHRGRWYGVTVERDRFLLYVEQGGEAPVPVEILGELHMLAPGERFEVALPLGEPEVAPPA